MNRINAKRGTSLIEVVISLFVAMYISVISISIVKNIYKNYTNTKEYFIHLDSVDNAMNNLDNVFKSKYMKKIENSNDSISLIIKDEHKNSKYQKKIVYLRGTTLYIATYDIGTTENLSGNNVLLKNVCDFQVFRKENLIYFYIKTSEGVERVRCI